MGKIKVLQSNKRGGPNKRGVGTIFHLLRWKKVEVGKFSQTE